MTKIKKLIVSPLAAVFLMMLFFAGCELDIKNNVDYPAGPFKDTMKKIEGIHAKDPGRKGKVSNLNIMLYSGKDRKLISLSIPIEITKISIKNSDFGDNGELKKFSKKISDADIDLDKLKNLERFGPGLIAEVEVDEDKDHVHVLIWLD